MSFKGPHNFLVTALGHTIMCPYLPSTLIPPSKFHSHFLEEKALTFDFLGVTGFGLGSWSIGTLGI